MAQTYTIYGKKFASEPTYYSWDAERKYPNFEIIDDVKIIKKFESLDEAYKWMLINMPDFAIGCGIYDKNDNCLINAVKGYYIFLPDLEQKTIVDYELKCVEERIRKRVVIRK